MNRERLSAILRAAPFVPQPGPQYEAFISPADQLLYGGQAGGGKTALGIGLALTKHKQTLFVRREATQLVAVVDEIANILGTRDGYNGSLGIWRLPGGRTIRLGGVPNIGDESKFQGAAHDLKVFDECCHIDEAQVRFLLGWLRSTDRSQRCRALFCSNPPQSAEGEWVIRWWAPWLDQDFPNPAKPGELRWVAMIPGEGERWVDGPEPFTHRGETIRPLSRTFVPARVTDNRFLGEDYIRQLSALPEPLRSQLLHGSFAAGRSDDEWQVCPSAHVKAAMDRWSPSDKPGEIVSLGVDPSRGGDETIIAIRRTNWRFDPLIAVPPAVASTGGGVTKKILDVCGDSAPVHVDPIGVGASVIDHLESWIHRRCVPVNFASASKEADFTGNLKFVNRRAECWWRMREALEPSRAVKVALPRDQRLFADLCAPRYRLTSRGIQIEGKEEIIRRLGRSPDRGDAVVLASIRTPILRDIRFNTYRAWEG